MKINRIKTVLAVVTVMKAGVAFGAEAIDLRGSDKKDAASSSTNVSRPNIIIILADDLGCGDISLYDGWIKTPRIDQMAKEGVFFTDFHSNGSVCSPTRAALLTGQIGRASCWERV